MDLAGVFSGSVVQWLMARQSRLDRVQAPLQSLAALIGLDLIGLSAVTSTSII